MDKLGSLALKYYTIVILFFHEITYFEITVFKNMKHIFFPNERK